MLIIVMLQPYTGNEPMSLEKPYPFVFLLQFFFFFLWTSASCSISFIFFPNIAPGKFFNFVNIANWPINFPCFGFVHVNNLVPKRRHIMQYCFRKKNQSPHTWFWIHHCLRNQFSLMKQIWKRIAARMTTWKTILIHTIEARVLRLWLCNLL